MNDDGSDRYGNLNYFHADADGNPDLSRPMTKAEIVEMYWLTVDEEPSTIADLYLDFYIFRRIEFLIFSDRLSAAILVARAAKKEMNKLEEHFKTQQEEGSHILFPDGKQNRTTISASRWA
jgi:hypothetical protein